MQQNISDRRLCEILGSELTDNDMIDSKMAEAYAIIRKLNKEKGAKKRVRKVFIGIGSAAAVFILAFAFCVMNPVMASGIPIVGSLFAKVAEVFPFGKIPEEQSESLYGRDGAGYRVTQGDITVTLEEEYVSNQALFVGIRIENAAEFPRMAAYVETGTQWLYVRTIEDYSFRQEPIMTRRTIEGKFEDAHTFIGIMRIDYSEIATDSSRYNQAIDEADAKGEAYPELNNLTREEWLDYYAIPESFDMKLEIFQIIGVLDNPTRPEGMKSEEELAGMSDEELGEYRNSLPKEWVGFPNAYQHWYCDGNWLFELPIARTDKAGRIIEIHEENGNGLGIESMELSSVEMTLNTIIKTTDAMITTAFDADGEELEYSGSDGVYVIAGHDISTVDIYICKMEEWEKAGIKYQSPENDKDFQTLIKECALFHATVDTTE